MSFIVYSNSTRVILPIRVKSSTDAEAPTLTSVLISQSKPGGHFRQISIELSQPGLERPFLGDRWGFDWRVDGEKHQACWLGFPNTFFSSSIDPWSLVLVELIGHLPGVTEEDFSMGRIEITVHPSPELVREQGSAAWVPDSRPKVYPKI